MKIGEIKVTGNRAEVTYKKLITSGTVGATVEFNFDEMWDGLHKTLVWKGSGVTVDDTDCTGIVPAEVLTMPGSSLAVGVYGVTEGKVVPTIWADLGTIRAGADPSGDKSTDPFLPVWMQLKEAVAALEKSIGKVKSVNGETPDENGNITITVTNGKDGVSPSVSVEATEGGHRVSITDAGGPKTFDVMDGTNGKDGADGYTPQKGVDYFDGENGKDGKDGADGYTPVKGTDYYTEADKQEIVNAVLANFINVSEVGM